MKIGYEHDDDDQADLWKNFVPDFGDNSNEAARIYDQIQEAHAKLAKARKTQRAADKAVIEAEEALLELALLEEEAAYG